MDRRATQAATTDAPSTQAFGSDEPTQVAAFPPRNAFVQAVDNASSAPSRRKIWAFVALIAAIGVGVVAWRPSEPPVLPATASPSSGPLELAPVDVTAVERRSLSRTLPLSGSIAPVVQATVKAKVGGEIEAVTHREGEDIREGEVIARIDTRNLQAQYDREMAAVEKASADLDLARLNRDKNRALLEQKYISQTTYEATESAYAAAVASLKLAQAQARVAKIALDDAVVRAPFTGTIAQRWVHPGEKVSADTQLVTLVDLRQLVLEAAVPTAEVPYVNVGQSARFRVGGFGAREFEGVVQRINPVTLEGSRAITLYIAVANDDRALKGGMFAQGQLLVEASEPVLAIPRAAVHEEAGVPVVYTFEDGTIGRREVALGTPVEGSLLIEVRQGLTEGEQVILVDIGERKAGSAAVLRPDRPIAAG